MNEVSSELNESSLKNSKPGTDLSGMVKSVGSKNEYVACGTPEVADFMAGQNILAGSVTVANDEEFVYVTFSTIDGWVLGKTHLFVGGYAYLPVNKKSNPKIGKFPDQNSHDPYVTEFTYQYLMDDLVDCFVIAAHAEVHLIDETGEIIQSETAWADGEEFNESGSWATYFEYCMQECCEKVFGFFGDQTILVGNLSVTNDENNLYVTYKTDGGWYFTNTHLYVGELTGLPDVNASNFPRNFPYLINHDEIQEYTYTIPLDGLPECYIIAAHAEVHHFINQQSKDAWSSGTSFPNLPQDEWGWYSSYCTQYCD